MLNLDDCLSLKYLSICSFNMWASKRMKAIDCLPLELELLVWSYARVNGNKRPLPFLYELLNTKVDSQWYHGQLLLKVLNKKQLCSIDTTWMLNGWMTKIDMTKKFKDEIYHNDYIFCKKCKDDHPKYEDFKRVVCQEC